MADTRQGVEDQLEQEPQPDDRQAERAQPGRAQPGRAQAGQERASSHDAASSGENDASAEARARDDDEDALRGDVDALVAAAAQRDEYLALAQRTQADFENYRKRVAKELAAAQERGAIKLARELLPALDNLDRALREAESGARDDRGDSLLEGVRLVRAELHAALARLGIESFSPLGACFDPAEHEAMAQQPVADTPSGTVAEVFQPGYKLGA